MKNIITIPFFLFFAFIAMAQDINSLIKEADKLEDVPNELAAFNKFKEALKMQMVCRQRKYWLLFFQLNSHC